MKRTIFHSVTNFCCCICLLVASKAVAQDSQQDDRIGAIAEHLAKKQKYLLQYKFAKGDVLNWEVEHTTSTKAQIAATLEETSSRSQSGKQWQVVNVDQNGNMRFVHSIQWAKMWQQVGENEPVTYDSRQDKSSPAEFVKVEKRLGKPLAMITVAPNGQIVDRKTTTKQTDFGVGEICIPMPKDKVSVGHQWHVPTRFSGNDEHGRKRQLNAQVKYKLAKVKGKFAYISFNTVVRTPIESQKVRSQILQKLTRGYAVFDIPAGRIVRKEVEWNETVQGYEGPDSFLSYNCRLTEKFVESGGDNAADRKVTANLHIRDRDERPSYRY